jgi:heme-degrading monooxygenase HmoA
MYHIIWKFTLSDGSDKAFEKAYGPQGDWAVFFKGAKGYSGTELLRDIQDSGQYITIDRWSSREAYDQFRKERLNDYKAMDERMEPLIEFESHVGSYTTVE